MERLGNAVGVGWVDTGWRIGTAVLRRGVDCQSFGKEATQDGVASMVRRIKERQRSLLLDVFYENPSWIRDDGMHLLRPSLSGHNAPFINHEVA